MTTEPQIFAGEKPTPEPTKTTGTDKSQIRRRMLDLTREGPVTQWSNRLAELARKTGLLEGLEHINWNDSPIIVAHSIIGQAEQRGLFDKLVRAVDSQEAIARAIEGK